MILLDVGIAAAIILGLGGLAVHHRFRRARHARIRTEAETFDGRLDDSE